MSTRDKDQNPDTQLFALRDYCKAHNYEIIKEYVDEASATDLRGRRQWRELLSKVRVGGFDAVMVLRLDRAFRSTLDTYDTLAQFNSHKIGFISITQPIDTTTATGKLLLGILATVAEFEKELIHERINEGLSRAKAQGKKLGRPAGRLDKTQRKKSGYFSRWSNQREKVT